MMSALVLLAALLGATPVVEVREHEAFIARGQRHGLAVGQAWPVTRAGVVVDHCAVVAVSDHHARCRLEQGTAHVADTVEVIERVERDTAATPPRRRPTPATLRALAQATREHVAPLVNHTRAPRPPPRRPTSATLSLQQYAALSTSTPGVSSLGLRLQFGAHVDTTSLLQFGSAARISGRVTTDAIATSNDRFRAGTVVALELYEAAFVLDDHRLPWHVLAGRFASAEAVGLPLLDGVQVGHRVGDWRAHHRELGVFLGTRPQLVTLVPTTNATVGVYATEQWVLPARTIVNARARAGIAFVDDDLPRADSEADLRFSMGNVAVASTGARLSASATSNAAEVALTRAHADIDVRMLPWLSLFAGLRHQAPSLVDGDRNSDGLARDTTDLDAAVVAAQHLDLGVRLPVQQVEFAVVGSSSLQPAASIPRHHTLAVQVDAPLTSNIAGTSWLAVDVDSAGRFGQLASAALSWSTTNAVVSLGASTSNTAGTIDVAARTGIDVALPAGWQWTTRTTASRLLSHSSGTVVVDSALTTRW